MKKTILFAAAAAAVVGSMPALAASSASASITDLTVTLYDLNPADGIDTSISFYTDYYNPYGSYVSTSANDAASGAQSGQAWNLTTFGPVSSTSSVGGASATASVSGNVLGGGGGFAAAGSAAGAVLPGFGTGFSATAQAGNGSLYFALSPYTLVVFSGTASLSAATTVGIDPLTGNSESAGASVTLSIGGPGAAGSGSQYSNDGYSLYAYWDYLYDPTTGVPTYAGQSQSITGATLAGSFTNYTAGGLSGSFSLVASVNGNSAVTAVPEPQTAAMLLAGLMAVGFVARRRRG